MSDLLTLLHSERRLLEAMAVQDDHSVGLPRTHVLRWMNDDPDRLARLVAAQVLIPAGERYRLSSQVEALLVAPSARASVEELRQAMQTSHDMADVRQALQRLQSGQAWTSDTLEDAHVLLQHPDWTDLCSDPALEEQYHRTWAHLQEVSAERDIPFPDEWQAPELRHLLALQALSERGQLLTHTNLREVLTSTDSLWLDGSERHNLRPDPASVAQLTLSRRKGRRRDQATDVLVPEAPTESEPAEAWFQSGLWAAFVAADTDLLSFLRARYEDVSHVRAGFLAIVSTRSQDLRIEPETILWEGRHWAKVCVSLSVDLGR